jgi:phospholipid/cholesterol/gamma-HCH transport system substrate-binding protein
MEAVSDRSIEIKVGLLIMVAIGLFAAFVLVMGQINFQPKYRAFVDFDNPGGVTTGSAVRVAGVKVGRVESIQYRGGQFNPQTHQREPLVRIELTLEKRYANAIRTNSVFYVTTQGVLGEQFIQIDPGSAEKPVLEEGAVARALAPPRLDMLLAESYELLHSGVMVLRDNRQEIAEMFTGLHDTLQGTGEFFKRNQDRLDRIAARTEQLVTETNELLVAARSKYVDGPQVTRILDRVEHTTEIVSREVDPLLQDVRETLANTARLSKTVGAADQQTKIRAVIADTAEIATRAKAAVGDAQSIVAKIRHGEGSVGALVMDEQIYDDIQEMTRDLKHNPWKFFWRE